MMKRTILAGLAIGLNRIALKLSTAAGLLPLGSPEYLQERLNDWPQLNVYRALNTTLAPSAAENRVVFFGDSITADWDLAAYFPNAPYLNRGIGGQTTPQMLVRFRPDVIALKPQLVIILAGTNDIAGNTGPMTLEMIQQNYASMAELAKSHGIQVIFASLLPIHDYGATKISFRRPLAKIQALNQWLQDYCAEQDCIYLDYYSSMVDGQGWLRSELSDDGLHPNPKGYNVMAPLAFAAIQQALGKVSNSPGSS